MELLILLVYAALVWFIFIKKKWLPWNFVSQMIVAVIPVIGLSILILFLNIFAPESKDVRVINYVVPVVWANAQGQLPISGGLPVTGSAPVPEGRLAVRLGVDDRDKDLFLAAGARGSGAIYTNGAEAIHILRKVIIRIHTKLDWLILKL